MKDREFIKEFEKTIKESSLSSLKLMRELINQEYRKKIWKTAVKRARK